MTAVEPLLPSRSVPWAPPNDAGRLRFFFFFRLRGFISASGRTGTGRPVITASNARTTCVLPGVDINVIQLSPISSHSRCTSSHTVDAWALAPPGPCLPSSATSVPYASASAAASAAACSAATSADTELTVCPVSTSVAMTGPSSDSSVSSTCVLKRLKARKLK